MLSHLSTFWFYLFIRPISISPFICLFISLSHTHLPTLQFINYLYHPSIHQPACLHLFYSSMHQLSTQPIQPYIPAHLSTLPFTHPSTYQPFVQIPIIHPPIYLHRHSPSLPQSTPPLHHSLHSSIHSLIHPLIHPSNYPSIHPFTCLFVHSSIDQPIGTFIHLPTMPFSSLAGYWGHRRHFLSQLNTLATTQ